MFYGTTLKRPVPSEAVVGDDHKFLNPVKLVKTVSDMKMWDYSEAYFEYLGFILAINEAVKGKSNTEGSKSLSQPVKKTLELLNILDKMIDEIPPIQQPQRFGNQAFRTWYQRLQNGALDFVQDILPDYLFRAVPEIMVYLVDGFGNSTRIDYGTGHEISFIMFLCCLFKIGFLHDEDRAPTACRIFTRYLEIVRKLQTVYRMEPAGSHGVWSLDDYQFVPFIWGSSQLLGHPIIEPQSFLKPEVINEFSEDYMFLSCIRYINEVKTGPFAEHSNQLWSISGVSSWSKINGGLVKMYKVEVLGKFPVVQHILFGSLFTLNPAPANSTVTRVRMNIVPPPTPFKMGEEGSEFSGVTPRGFGSEQSSVSTKTGSSEKKEIVPDVHESVPSVQQVDGSDVTSSTQGKSDELAETEPSDDTSKSSKSGVEAKSIAGEGSEIEHRMYEGSEQNEGEVVDSKGSGMGASEAGGDEGNE